LDDVGTGGILGFSSGWMVWFKNSSRGSPIGKGLREAIIGFARMQLF
jgi:hypothetical protein